MFLSNIASVHSGLTLRGRLRGGHGGHLALQMADIEPSGHVDLSRVARIDAPHPRYAVAHGDILFRSRGQSTMAWAVPAGLPDPAVAILPLFIIRPATDSYDPHFLAWYLNQPDAQQHMRRAAQGQTIQMVSKLALESTPLLLPPITQQRLIADAARLAASEAQLMHRLADCQHTLRQTQLTSAALAGQSHPKAGRK